MAGNMISVPDIIAQGMNSNQDAFVQMQDIFNQMGKKTAQMAALDKTIPGTTETPLTVQTKALGELEAQSRVQSLAAEAGFSSDMSIDIQAAMLRNISETGRKIEQTSAKLAQDKSVSLFEDPLQALMNAFTIPWDEQELEGLTTQRDQSVKTLNDLSAGITNSATAAKAIATHVTDASILDQTTRLENTLAAEKLAGEAKALEFNLRGLQNEMTYTADQIAKRIQIDEFQARSEVRELNKLQKEAYLKAQDDKLKNEKEQDIADNEILRLANLALTREGLPTFGSVGELKSKITRFPKENERVLGLVNKGRVIEMDNMDANKRKTEGLVPLGPAYSHGDTPVEIIKYQNENGIRPKTPDQATYFSLVRQAAAAAEAKKTKADGKEYTAEEFIREKMTEMENVKYGDDSNPMRAPALSVMATQPAIANNPIFKTAVAPFITDANKNQSAHPNVVVPMVYAAVRDGKVNVNAAADFLSTFYGSAIGINNEYNEVAKLTNFKQKDFNVILKSNSRDFEVGPVGTFTSIAETLSGGRTTYNVNMRDPVSVRNMLTKKLSTDLYSNIENTEFNSKGLYPPGHTGFYPPITLDKRQVGEQ